MGIEGKRTCAVRRCTAPVSAPSNLCINHLLPGAVVRSGKNTYVITCWYAEHQNEVGVILLNDFALGDLFGGRAGFEAKLREQGFVNVRSLGSQTEVDKDTTPPPGKKAGMWGGPWLQKYPWEAN